MTTGGRIPWNVTAMWNSQDQLSARKTPYERRFGMPFYGPILPFGAMVEYHPVLQKTNLDCIRSAQKCCQVYSSVMYCMREDSGKETLWSRT